MEIAVPAQPIDLVTFLRMTKDAFYKILILLLFFVVFTWEQSPMYTYIYTNVPNGRVETCVARALLALLARPHRAANSI